MKTPLAIVRAWLAPQNGSTLSPTEHTGTATVAGVSHDRGRTSAIYQVPVEHDRLLERASVAWHLGDWDSLTRLDAEGVARSPYRARIALFMASAFLQTDKPSDASRLFQQATEWGCDPQSMSEILMAGAHHNVGRAALLLGDTQQEQEHVLRSSAIGWTASPNTAVAAARAEATRHEFARAGLQSPAAPALPAALPSNTASGARSSPLPVEHPQLKQELDRLKSQLVQEVKAAAENTAKQLEAFLSIQHYLNTGELQGEMHGWPISPDIGMYLIRRVELGAYDVIVEFGSGVSTLLMAKAAMNIRARGGKAPVHVVFEHLEEYYFQTAALLESSGARQAAQLELTPLEPYAASEGMVFQFYGCSSVLRTLRDQSSGSSLRILVVVDGPPGSTGPHARFPALPLVLSHFADSEVDVLLDDYGRKEEREIVEIWSSHLDKLGLAHHGTALKFEKGAYLLHIHRDGSHAAPDSGN